MPKLTMTDLAVDEYLTNLIIANIQDAKGYACQRVFGKVPVDDDTGKYWKFTRDDLFRTDAKQRAPGTPYTRKTLGLGNSTFSLTNWGLEFPLPDEFRKKRKSPLANDGIAVRALAQDLLIRREITFKEAFLVASVWASDKTGGVDFTKWNLAAADIVGDVLGWGDTIKTNSGKRPNVGACSSDVWRTIKNDPDIVDRVKHTSKEPVTEEIVARLFGVEELVVMDAVQNSAQEGAAISMGFIMPTCFLLTYRNPNPDLYEPSAGYLLSWNDFDEIQEASENGAPGVFTYRDEPTKSDIYRAEMYHGMIVSSSDCGLLALSVI